MRKNNGSHHDKIEQIRLLKHISSRFPSFRGESIAAVYRRMQSTRTPELDDHRLAFGPYDPEWPRMYNRQAQLLKKFLPLDAEYRLHHIGSTAISGMASNAIIDMALVVDCHDDVDSCPCQRALEQSGFQHFGNSPLGPEAQWHWNTNQSAVVFVLHLDNKDNCWLEGNLRFCRYMAAHSLERDRYLEFKEQNRELKIQNITLYSLKKLQLIIDIAEKAEQWEKEVGR